MIDVMMILTIFLAVMAFLPQVRTSIQAQLPQASHAEDTPPSLTFQLTKAGLTLEEVGISPDGIEGAVKAALGKNDNTSFVIAADKALPYEQVINLVDRVKGAGAKRIALATTKAP